MRQQLGSPAAWPVLYAVTGDVTAPGSVTAPPVAGDGKPVTKAVAVVPMPVAERARAAGGRCAKRAVAAAQELWLHPDRLVYVLWHGKPESASEHFAYVASRAWVPEELTGKKAALITWTGFAYHVLIACPVKFAAKTVDAAAERPLRLAMLAAFIFVLCLILSHL